MKQLFLFAGIFLVAIGQHASAAEHIWSGASVPPTNVWSDANNFDGSPLTAGDSVTFGNAGSVAASNVVDNVADNPPVLANFSYKAQVSGPAAITNYHTTRINPGVLTLDNGGNSGLLLNVGDVDTGLIDAQYFCTITGAGATLQAGNTNAPVSTQ